MMDKILNVVMLGDSITQSGGIATLQKLIIKYAATDLQIDRIATRDLDSKLTRELFFARSMVLLIWRLLSKKTDLVHIHIAHGGSILRKAIIASIAFTFRKPVLMHAHGAEFHLNYANSPQPIQRLMQKIFNQCHGWIALTSFWQDFYISTLGLDPQKVFVLLNPTELPSQIPQRLDSPKIKLVFLGNIGERKGTFDLIEAFAKLPVHLRNSAELSIAGDGKIAQAKELADRLNLGERVNFLGLIDAHDRDLLLEHADIYVLPTYNEGLPLALLEAMSWGLPVITTPVSGIPDVVQDRQNGLLVNPGDIQQLTDRLQLLIENEALRLSLGKAARATAATLDVDHFSSQLDRIYREVANATSKTV
jgi:glycosyltransferase involved in cell wall biosynthesis